MSADRKVSQRHKARRVAVQSLYWLESQPWDELRDVVESVAEEFNLAPPGQRMALNLARRAFDLRGDYERELATASQNWDADRIGRLEHIIITLALAEWDHEESDAPPKVVLSEAVTLAGEFVGEDSAGFVNGVLDQLGHNRGLLG